MLTNNYFQECCNVLFVVFSVYLFFFYFNIFFPKKKEKTYIVIGVVALIVWQFGIPNIILTLSLAGKIFMAGGVTLFAVVNIYEDKFWKKSFFSITFVAIWMLVETLVGDCLMIYCDKLVNSMVVGSLISKICFYLVLLSLKKVFTNEEVAELSAGHSILLVLIPIGSIFIMNNVFMLAYQTEWEHAEKFSLISIIILLLINVLIFYIYIKLADDLQIRRRNLVYEQQLELCARHQEETEYSMLQMRDIRHNMKNQFISILAYAEKGEYEKIVDFINDVMDEGNLKAPIITSSGNIVIDSLIGYWYETAKNKDIDFKAELCIPMILPYKGADISLILGNLLENATEAAGKAPGEKYIRLKIKYDKENLLIILMNSYDGKIIKTKGGELRSTKTDASNHGIGIPSIRRVVRKYHGTMMLDDTSSAYFLVRIVLYGP